MADGVRVVSWGEFEAMRRRMRELERFALSLGARVRVLEDREADRPRPVPTLRDLWCEDMPSDLAAVDRGAPDVEDQT